jgi:hypothetical protein
MENKHLSSPNSGPSFDAARTAISARAVKRRRQAPGGGDVRGAVRRGGAGG